MRPRFERDAGPGMTTPLLALENVGKDYAKVETRGGRLRLVFDLLRGHGAAHVFRALDDVSFDDAARRIARHHRRKRRGQVDAAQDRRGRHPADARQRRRQVVASARCSSSARDSIPSTRASRTSTSPPRCSGLAPSEIAAKRDEIIAFADLGEHINDPIKHYSSGMVVRLGFAVATALSPDVLITDEVLAVGDESFQKKCIAWMERYLAGGGTLLLCSHSMYHIQKLCTHALWLKDGRVERYGPATTSRRPISRTTRKRARARKRPVGADRAAASGWYAIEALTIDPPETIEQGAHAGGSRRSVLARRSRRRSCSSASCAPTARRCTGSPPTWRMLRRCASTPDATRSR